MLRNLVIKNYALIRELEMSPSAQLNIITGETGAGKSIMLGAIGLLLGKRADTRALYDEDLKCVIEGIFDLSSYALQSFFEKEDLDYENECIIRREISPAGKSRAFVNDTPVTLDVLRTLGSFLMDIHSQHDTLRLASNSFQLNMIDNYAGNHALRQRYTESFFAYENSRKAYEKLQAEAVEIKKAADYNQFLYEEFVAARLEEGEQERLEDELAVLEHAEEIKTRLNQALDLMNGAESSVTANLYTATHALRQIEKFSDTYQTLTGRAESCLIELKDLAAEIEQEEQKVVFDNQKTEAVQERLSMIYQLQQKHQVGSVDELIQIFTDLASRVNKEAQLDEELAALKEQLAVAEKNMKNAAQALRASREKVFPDLARELTQLLSATGMPDASLKIESKAITPALHGADEISVLFSANKGIQPQELKNVASGGEFSRLMFCVKYILARKTALPTIVFDEIDTGISGEIAIKMAHMMKTMAENHQVIAISHLPQLAAGGDTHYFVFKDNSDHKTVSKIKKLSDKERIDEIAKMIGGENPSAVAYENAKELINIH